MCFQHYYGKSMQLHSSCVRFRVTHVRYTAKCMDGKIVIGSM
jgi:hypothetical protein